MNTRSTDPRLPLYLRLTALAVERSDDNGKAVFQHGELRAALCLETVAVPSSRITEAVKAAVRAGFLEDGSSTRCLLLVPGSLTKGASGVRGEASDRG